MGVEVGCFGCGCVGVLGYLLWIVVIVWMYKDAVKRGMDNPWIWIAFGIFMPVVSLIVYVLIRDSHPPRPPQQPV